MEISHRHPAKNSGVIFFLALVLVFQIYITYQSYREGGGSTIAENIIWPYFILALIIGVITDKVDTPQFGFSFSFIGFILLIIVNIWTPSTKKIVFSLLLALFSIYYGLKIIE